VALSDSAGERFVGIMGPLLGHGIFNTDGAPWKFHRSMSRPFFAKEKIQHFQIFDRHADDAVGQIRDRLREGVPIDIQVRSLCCVREAGGKLVLNVE
jgi:cytochrome P450